MVVLSVAVLSKSGKVLLARQYVEMTRLRIEGILAAFPKLIESGSEGVGKQHTYVETGSIRYVYQPIESVYLVLVTTRGSNIVEDLDTLRLLSKVVPEYSAVSEEDIQRNSFDLVFAFDEVITLGYKENITLDGIRTNVEMDSHNEKLHIMVRQSKMNEAKDEARRKAASIKAAKSSNPMPGIGNTPMPGMGNSPGSSMGGMGGMGGSSMGSFGNTPDMDTGASSMGMGSTSSMPDSSSRYGGAGEKAPATSSGMKLGKGLKLGNKGAKGLSDLQQMAKEEGYDANALVQQQSAKANVAAPGAVVRTDPIEVRIAESVSCLYDKDGAMHKLEVKGSISLLCHEDDSKVRLVLHNYGDVSAFQFTPHPNLSKPDFSSSNVLQMKNASKAFPKEKSLGILKWRFAAKEDETMVPLKVTCWPESNGDGTVTISMELELLATSLTLHNVVVSIPLPTGDEPEILAVEGGTPRHDAKRHQMDWELPLVDKENAAANFEFMVTGSDEADFFPVTMAFTSEDTLCPVHVQQVEDVESSEPAKFGLYRQLQADKYEIVAAAE